MKKIKLVIDTNILLVSLPEFSPWHWLIEALLNSRFILLLSNEIIFEYDEKLLQRYDKAYSKELLDLITDLDNVQLVAPFFNWNLILADAEDNKFVDCAIAGNADYIISNDKHFRVLEQINFPRLHVLTLSAFETRFKEILIA